MKRFAMFCAAILLALGVVQAQSYNLLKVHFSTPVTAGVTELPAGDATIQVLQIGAGTLGLLVRSGAGPQTTVLVNRISRFPNSEEAPVVVQFDRHGDTLILDKVWISETQGFQVIR